MTFEYKKPTPKQIKAATIEIDPKTLTELKDWAFIDVRWKDDEDKIHYGSVCTHEKDAQSLFDRGGLIVSHAVLPETLEIPISKIDAALKMNHHANFRWDTFEVVVYTHTERQKAEEHAQTLPAGLVKGKLFSVGVADGYATYIVTKVNPKTVKVEWRGFCPDRYTDQVLGWGGTFRRENIEPLVVAEESIKKLFAS